jgi:hypothetical protein
LTKDFNNKDKESLRVQMQKDEIAKECAEFKSKLVDADCKLKQQE